MVFCWGGALEENAGQAVGINPTYEFRSCIIEDASCIGAARWCMVSTVAARRFGAPADRLQLTPPVDKAGTEDVIYTPACRRRYYSAPHRSAGLHLIGPLKTVFRFKQS